MIFYDNDYGILYNGDWRIVIPNDIEDDIVDCCITSPPYWKLRGYGDYEDQLGQEEKFEDYVDNLVKGFNNIKSVLKDTGTLFVNLGDTFSGNLVANTDRKKKETVRVTVNKGKTQYPDKCLLMIPERFAIAMIDDGWILRNKIVWHKPNQVPYSQSNGLLDRFNISHEYLFFFTKMKKNYSFTTIYEPSIEGKRIMRDVWSINTEALKGNHPATYPTELVKRCIEAGCPVGGTVLDPFMGSGTTAYVAQQLDRHWIGIELNRDYCVEISNRMRKIGKFL